MLYLTAETKILIAVKPVDFRKQIDGLVALCEHHLNADPRSGTLFVFINRPLSRLIKYISLIMSKLPMKGNEREAGRK